MPSVWKAVRGIAGVAAALSPQQQNGKSLFGTLGASTYPQCLQNNPMPNGYPWGTRTTNNTDPSDIPNTGVTRYYEFTIARAVIAPDGVERDAILVNDQFPGPVIEANWGDWIEVTIHNQISGPEEGTSMHWHGLFQKDTPWYDGVPSISQCPIAPGSSFTYRFRASEYGTTWYHAHYSAQYNAGVLGPLIIYGPTQLDYDIDVGPVILSDWYHVPYFEIVENVVGTDLSKLPPHSDTNLINGKNNFDCSTLPANTTLNCTPNAGLAKFRFKKGKSHRLRLLNTGADGVQKFSIDGHKMTIIAVDLTPVVPYETDVVTLGVAQRTDVIVTADGDADAYWMRATIVNDVSCGNSLFGDALAVVYYDNADTSTIPSTTSSVNSTVCANDPLTSVVPEYAITPSEPSYTQVLQVNLTINSTGHPVWSLNGIGYRANFNFPILLLANQGNTSYPYDPQWNVYNFGQNTSVRIVLENLTPFVHPFHIHGHSFYVLNEGVGKWDGSTIVNGDNPIRRDTQLLQSLGFAVLQYEANNPGVWPFHCHVAWHLSGGLSMSIMSHPEKIVDMPIPDIMQQTCTDWGAYTDSSVVGQIDSGS